MPHLTEGTAASLSAMVASLEQEVLRAMDDAIFGSLGELQFAAVGADWAGAQTCAS